MRESSAWPGGVGKRSDSCELVLELLFFILELIF
jgi:hypothetical protein